MEYEFNKSFFENHGKKEEYYSKIFPSKLRDTFSDSQKEERATQIDYLEKEILGNNAIKIRVRPGIIKAFANLTGVHDFKGGGYRGDTIYLGHTSDLFNPQIVRHEGIHILQQRELGSSNLGGFINWAIESLIKGPKKYKQEHKGEKITNYDLSSKPPLELESYANQMNPDDINYIRRRKKCV